MSPKTWLALAIVLVTTAILVWFIATLAWFAPKILIMIIAIVGFAILLSWAITHLGFAAIEWHHNHKPEPDREL